MSGQVADWRADGFVYGPDDSRLVLDEQLEFNFAPSSGDDGMKADLWASDGGELAWANIQWDNPYESLDADELRALATRFEAFPNWLRRVAACLDADSPLPMLQADEPAAHDPRDCCWGCEMEAGCRDVHCSCHDGIVLAGIAETVKL